MQIKAEGRWLQWAVSENNTSIKHLKVTSSVLYIDTVLVVLPFQPEPPETSDYWWHSLVLPLVQHIYFKERVRVKESRTGVKKCILHVFCELRLDIMHCSLCFSGTHASASSALSSVRSSSPSTITSLRATWWSSCSTVKCQRLREKLTSTNRV